MKQTVLYNGKIYLERARFAQAVLIEDGVFRMVGSNDEVRALAGPSCTFIDCEGRTVVPGLNDSHMHLLMVGEGLAQVNISDCASVEEMVRRCRDFMRAHPEACRHGLHSVGWNQDLFTEGEKRIPTKHDLDQISTEIPIVLERICGHIVTGNSKVIEKLGLTGSSPQYEGGEFGIGADGAPNGVFNENACQYALSTIPPITIEQHESLLLQAMDYAVAHGLTSVQSNDIGTSTHDYERGFAMFHKVYDEGRGKLRYRHQVAFYKPEDFRRYLTEGEFRRGRYAPDGWLRLGPLKLFKDGSLGARTATMRHEYRDDPGNFGVEATSDAMMDEFCRLAADAGVQVVTHVIGDAAIEHTVASYEKILPAAGKNPLRHGLVHCQITDMPLLRRIAADDIITLYQPIFLEYDLHAVESRCGRELSSTSYAFGTLDKLGGKISYGTDSPVEDCNPFPNIYSAVTRRDLKGLPAGGFYPQECVDVCTAVDAYTLGSAYAEFQEDVKGRIRGGFLADLVVLDRDIFTCDPMEIKDILPVLTMVGGEIVYRK